MTDELEGDTITEFVSGGPKNYGYKTTSGKVCCKVRGFTLNVRGDCPLNFDIMRQNVLDELERPLPDKRLTDVDNPPQPGHQEDPRHPPEETVGSRV